MYMNQRDGPVRLFIEMPPFTIRQLNVRYAPYHQAMSLHKIWKVEKPYDREKLTIHRIFSLDAGVSASPAPRQLIDTTTDLRALEQTRPIVSLIPKPPGEAGRSSGSARGYSLHQTLQWKDYREVLVGV